MISVDTRREEGHRSRRPSLRPLRLVTAGGLLVGATNLLAAAPAWAHDGHAGALTSVDAAVVRCLVLVGGALVGGVALLRPLTGPVNTATRRVVVVAACAAVAGLLQLASSGRAAWWLAIVQALVTLVVAFSLVAPFSMGVPITPGRRIIAAVGGLVVTLTLAVEATVGDGWIEFAAGTGHAAAASVWVAATVIVALADAGTRAALLRRLTPVAVSAGVLVIATGAVQAWLDGLRLDSATAESLFARVVAGKTALLVGVAVLGPFGYRRLVRGRPLRGRLVSRLRISAIGLAVALVAGAALAAIDIPPAPPVPGAPLLRSVATGAAPLPVVVVPQRPGWNLVHLGAADTAVGVDSDRLVPATPRPGSAGGWALVRLPAGKGRLWVRQGGRLASLRIDTGRTAAPLTDSIAGPDGPECVSAVLGSLAAGRDTMPDGCPADRLTDRDAASLSALVTFLAGRGVRAVTVLDDPSPRSRAAALVVRAAAARHRLTTPPAAGPDGVVIVVSGWSAGDATLRGVAGGDVPGAGTYLAPWLANARLLAYGSGAVVALRYDPRDPGPLRYARALRDRFGGEAATAAGYEAWLTGADGAWAGPTHLYAAALVSYLPAQFAHDHGARGGWLPGGTITKVTPPLQE
jgi:hypothetical protein